MQKYFLTADGLDRQPLAARRRLGWRLDVMTDPSFPDGYWETFRKVVKSTEPYALIISEAWQKNSHAAGMLHGDQADSTMNYRLRDAVIGLLAPAASTARASPTAARPITADGVRQPDRLDPPRTTRSRPCTRR